MKFTDIVTLDGVHIRDDGYLVADAKVARTGIQIYAGVEVGRPEMDQVRVYRPGSEVFSEDTMASFAHRPVTNDHPAERVTADNWKDHAVGQTGDEITGEKIFLRVPLMVADASAIKAINGGKRELSAGYECDLKWDAGETPSGEAYDAMQTNIRANHVAIVHRGRAGKECRIGDDAASEWGAAPLPQTTKTRKSDMSDDTLRTVVVDGLSVNTTDQGAQAIEKLQKAISDSQKAFSDAQSDHTAALATKDEEIGTLKAENKKLKDDQPDASAIDQMVADRAELVTKAKTVMSDIEVDGLSDADIRRKVVSAKMSDDAKDASDEQITGMFKVIAADAKPGKDPIQDALKSGDAGNKANDNGQAGYEKNLNDAWKG
ncbi:MAG: DUF2213 domain-containing protein, partial [Phycisphaeraceae bacterium]|nr:DUF2213 domain-containing protein [Phycisphaeraceae bacterium]